MLFLFRSVFWLSIVFASISWPGDPLAWRRRELRGVRSAGRKPRRKGLRAPAACRAGAAHLSRMGAGQRSGGNDKTRQIRRLLIRRAPLIKYNKANPWAEIWRRPCMFEINPRVRLDVSGGQAHRASREWD
jgi:hypothetical protein